MVVSKRSHIYFRETNKTFGFSIGLLLFFLRLNLFNLIFYELFCPCYAIHIAYKEIFYWFLYTYHSHCEILMVAQNKYKGRLDKQVEDTYNFFELLLSFPSSFSWVLHKRGFLFLLLIQQCHPYIIHFGIQNIEIWNHSTQHNLMGHENLRYKECVSSILLKAHVRKWVFLFKENCLQCLTSNKTITMLKHIKLA